MRGSGLPGFLRGEVPGDFFMDGSCAKRIIREMSRSSWSYVCLDPEAQAQVSVRGPIWGRMPQTPQVGKLGALAMAAHNVVGPSRRPSDCANVVSSFWADRPEK